MAKNYDSLKLDKQLCFPLYAASRVVNTELNLTYTQYIVMLVLWETDPITEKEMGKKLYLDSGTLTPVLKSLETKKYIVRSRSKEDERVVIVNLTKEGAALKDKAVGIPEQLGNGIPMDKEDQAALHALLYRLLGSMEEEQ